MSIRMSMTLLFRTETSDIIRDAASESLKTFAGVFVRSLQKGAHLLILMSIESTYLPRHRPGPI